MTAAERSNSQVEYFVFDVWRRRRSRKWRDSRTSWGASRRSSRRRPVRTRTSTTSRRDWRRRTSSCSGRCRSWTPETRRCPRHDRSCRLNSTRPKLDSTRRRGSADVDLLVGWIVMSPRHTLSRGDGMLYRQILYNSILLMRSRISLTTLVVLRFSFSFTFPGLRSEFYCWALRWSSV